MNEKKEPMIGGEDRPSAIDYDAPIADWKYRDIVGVIQAQIEQTKYTPQPEHIKPEKEYLKPERFKPELIKSEKEAFKPEKEMLKPEKEMYKPELSKPEKEFVLDDLVNKIAVRVVEMLGEKGLFK